MRTRLALRRLLREDAVVTDSLSVELACEAQRLWDFMWDPASSFVYEPGTEVATTLPGTPPRAAGEVQVFVSRHDGSRRLAAIEVLVAEPPRVAVTRGLDTVFEERQRLEISPLGPASSLLTQAFTTTVPAGLDVAYVEAVRAGTQDYLRTLRESLLSHFPTT